jgi:acyl-CoA dehydrogenase
MRSSETLPSSTCNPWKLLLASMPGIASGELMTAIAMTEPGTGSDLAGIRTTATRDGDHYVLNGAKTFITGGFNANLVLVVARTSPAAAETGVRA